MRFGYFLSCEEYSPAQLVEQAVAAEEAGFEALWISDHYHPWNDEQGQSPFVWGVIGALSQACSLPVTTAVTCPTIRIHPAVVAQAAATAAVQLDGRFILGVGTGEALNEHMLGDPWPSADVRLEMLEEAVELMRALWTGDVVTTPGTVLRRRHRPDLHAAGRAAAGLRLGVRPEGARPGRADRRRLHQHRRRRRGGRGVQGEVRRQALPGRREGRLGGHRGRGRRPRTPAVGERRAPGRAGPGAARARSTSSRPRSWSPASRPPRASSPATTSSSTSSSSATTSTPATTRCTSPTWARTTSP